MDEKKSPKKKPVAAKKTKKIVSATKLLPEGNHLIGPAGDLLSGPENLIGPEDKMIQP